MASLQQTGKRAVAVACVGAALFWSVVRAGVWTGLEEDGIHDPASPAVHVLQKPAEAFSRLPADTAGNQVDWVRALNDGYIRPRSRVHDSGPVELLDSDILIPSGGGIPHVLFPHQSHTQLLDCSSCHDKPFAAQAGANPMTMGKILEGEYCGVCHGKVAFPLTECNRCHSVPAE